jgi:hypothetical protein
MWKVIVQPCGDSDANKHFVDTILNPVDVERIKLLLTQEQFTTLVPIFSGRRSIPVWGVTPGKNLVNVGKWNRIESGDSALFSRSGKVFASAVVAAKVRSTDLSLDLWRRNGDGETWEYIYFLDELKSLDITYAEFNQAAGYEPNAVIQGFNVLSEERSQRLDNAFDLHSDRFPEMEDREAFVKDITKRFELAKTLDIPREAQSRLEQGYLRKSLFGRRAVATCCLCGNEFPVDLLIASHVKKRSFCSLAEQLDFENVAVPMCLMGCDALFERGYIFVDEHGLIRQGLVPLSSSGCDDAMQRVVGRRCGAFTASRDTYFKWHRDHHRLVSIK